MSFCDVCGQELTPSSDRLRLYVSKIKSREVSRAAGGVPVSQVATEYAEPEPVNVIVCSRHRKELIRQRLMPAIISFILIFLIIIFLVGLPFNALDWSPVVQVVVALVLTIGLVYLMLRTFISYDAIVASMLTLRSRQKGTGIEYMTERKYRILVRQKSRSGKGKGNPSKRTSGASKSSRKRS